MTATIGHALSPCIGEVAERVGVTPPCEFVLVLVRRHTVDLEMPTAELTRGT